MPDEPDVLIIGGGLAGLSCAHRLGEGGVSFSILERSDGPGGRARTDFHEDFLLDRGFQVLLTAYPEAQRTLDYGALRLHPFYPGALVYRDGAFHRLADPWRRPLDCFKSLFSGVGTLHDAIPLARLRRRVEAGSLEHLFTHRETTTIELLQELGFSDEIIRQFFRPFLGGVMLDRELQSSSRLFDFVFRTLCEGDAALPEAGMGALAEQLSGALPCGAIHLETPARRVEPDLVELETGEELSARAVVVATDGLEAARLLEDQPVPGWRSTTCLYFAAEQPPISEPILVLNGENWGLVNHLSVPSAVCPSYAPAGSALISANLIGIPSLDDEELVTAVREQLQRWFGAGVESWRHLRTYRIRNALPAQTPPLLSPPERPVSLHPGLYICGDYCETASIQGALRSGRRAAEEVLADLR